MTRHREIHDPWGRVDEQPDPGPMARLVEDRAAHPDQVEMRKRVLDWVGLSPGMAVLDVGCGTGVWSRDAVGRVGAAGRVRGVDPSRSLIEEARRLARERSAPPNVGFEVADGTALPFPDGSWDLVLAATVLGHVEDPARVIGELVRVTRRGGRVAIFDQDLETFVVNHSDRGLTRRIFHIVCDRRESEGWIGRRVLGLMRRAGLGGARCLPLAWVDTDYGPYMRQALKGRAAFAVEHGAISDAEAKAWLDELDARARDGTFFSGITYYGFVGTK